MPVCVAVLPFYALLVNYTVPLTAIAEVTAHRRSGSYPALLPGEVANVSVTVGLPPGTIAGDSPAADGAYRLRVDVVVTEGASGLLNLSTSALSPSALHPLVNSSGSTSLSANGSGLSYVVDFTASGNNSSSSAGGDGSLTLALTLTFADGAAYGNAKLNATAVLTQWRWHAWNLSDADGWEEALFNGTVNLTEPGVVAGLGVVSASALEWPNNCSLVDDSFSPLRDWADVGPCTRCVYLDSSLTLISTPSTVIVVNRDPRLCEDAQQNVSTLANLSFARVSAVVFSDRGDGIVDLNQRVNVSLTIDLPPELLADARLSSLTYLLRVTMVFNRPWLYSVYVTSSLPALDASAMTDSAVIVLGSSSRRVNVTCVETSVNFSLNAKTNANLGNSSGKIVFLADMGLVTYDVNVPGSYYVRTTITLMPWSWLVWNLYDSNPWEQAVAAAGVADRANLSLYRSWGALSGGSEARLPRGCAFVADDFATLSSWSQVQNCFRCIYYEPSSQLSTVTRFALTIVGPNLVIGQRPAWDTTFSAGDFYNWTIIIYHYVPQSRRNASNVQVRIEWNNEINIDKTSINVVCVSFRPCPLSLTGVNTSNLLISISELAINESLLISGSTKIPEYQILLMGNTDHCSKVTVSYDDVTSNETIGSYNWQNCLSCLVRGLDVLTVSTQQPSLWKHGQQGSVHATVSVPFGETSAFYISFETLVANMNPLINYTLTLTPALPTLIVADRQPRLTAVSWYTYAVRANGLSLSNPIWNGTNPTNLAVDFDYYLHPNMTKGAVITPTMYYGAYRGLRWHVLGTIIVAGPELVLRAAIIPNESIQAGDVLQWMVTVEHEQSTSNEDAMDLQISLVSKNYIDISNGVLSVSGIQENSTYAVQLKNSTMISIVISTFYLTNTSITINGTAVVNSKSPTTATEFVSAFQATVSYRQAPDSYILTKSTSCQIKTKNLAIEWEPMLSAWTPGLSGIISTTLLLPGGTVGNASTVIEMFAEDQSNLSVNVLSVDILCSTNLITYSRPSILNLSTASNLTITISVYDLVNLVGTSSPANCRFAVTYRLQENATLGQNMSFRMTWNFESNSTSLVRKASTVVAAPVLVIDCIVAPNGSMQAGSVLTWNVTVRHAVSSTTWARELKVLVTFDRYWEGKSATSSAWLDGAVVIQNNRTNAVAYKATLELLSVPMDIGGQIKVSDHLPSLMSGYRAVLNVQATYKGVGIQTVPNVIACSASSVSRPVTITGSSASFLPPSPLWSVGQPVTGTTALRMPPGIADVYFEFVVATVGAVPAFVPLKVDAPTASGPGVTAYMTSAAVSAAGRRRRAQGQSVFTSPTLAIAVAGPINTSTVDVLLTNTFYPSANSTPQTTVTVTAKLVVSGATNVIGSTVTKINAPSLTITKTGELVAGSGSSETAQTVNYTISLRHDSVSSYDAADLLINDLAQGMVLINSYQAEPHRSAVNFPDVNNVIWTLDYLPLGQTAAFWYLAQPAGYLGQDLPSGDTVQAAHLTYSMNVSNAVEIPSYSGVGMTCVSRVDIVNKTYWSDHGYTFLLAVIGVIGGIGIVVIVVIISILVMKRRYPQAYFNTVEPLSTTSAGLEYFQSHSKVTVTFESFGKAQRKGFNSLQDITQTSLEDSIVKVLTLRSRLRIGRELDCLDIKAASRADRQLEKSRLESLLAGLEALLRGMLHNGDISSRLFEDGKNKLKSSVDQGSKALEAEYEKLLNKTQSEMMAKYQKKFQEILKKHDARKEQVIKKTQDSSSKEVQEILSAVDDERDAEVEELLSIGRLQQEEEAEKLRRELILRRKIQLKECQQQLIQYVIAEAKLAPEQAQWLLQKHKEDQASIEKMYDNRMLQMKQQLEEKLAKRRMLAESTQAENERHSELLKQIGDGQIDMLKRAKKIGHLTPEELQAMLKDAMKRRSDAIEALERERARQEAALHEKLCQQKRKSLEAKEKENQIQYEALIQQQRQRLKTESVDPLLLETEKLELLAQQDAAMSELETKMDEANAAELNALQAQLVDKTKLTLLEQEKSIGELMKKEGMNNQQVVAILAEHDESVQRLKDVQNSQREKQETELQAKLQQRRREWQKSLEEEQAEQQALRQEEERILQELMAKQIAMSEEEREHILKQYEKNMAKMENNLTFNRLQHRRILEEKLAQRKAATIEKLEHELLLEQKTHAKRKVETEDDKRSSDIALLKKQARDRLNALKQTENVSLDEDMEKVKLEMMAERAKQLRDQEDHIGSLLVSLQLAKAKELAEIEEKQRAINALTTNLMEDLTDRGILSDPACQKVIERHQMDQEKLARRLEEEREKHERMLKAKLTSRLQQREKAMVAAHEERLRSVMKGAKGGTAALLRRVAIMARNKTEMEDFKIRMEKEISQTLEDMKRQQMTKKRRLVQELEMRFVSGLIKLGKLKRSELAECLKMLFPGKTSEELDQLITNLHEDSGTKAAAADENQTSGSEDDLATSSASMLKDRIQRAVQASYSSLRTVRESESEQPAETNENKAKTRPRKKKKLVKSMVTPSAATDSDEELLSPVSERHSDEDDGGGRPGWGRAANGSGDESTEPNSRRKARQKLDVTSADSRKAIPKDRSGDRRPSSRALPPLKALPSRRVGPNGDADYMP